MGSEVLLPSNVLEILVSSVSSAAGPNVNKKKTAELKNVASAAKGPISSFIC